MSLLAGLTKLVSLDLSNNQISDVTPLGGLSSLNYLYLAGNQVTDISPLSFAEILWRLDVSNQHIELPDAISGEPYTLPGVTWFDGAAVQPKIKDGQGEVANGSVTWEIPDGGEGTLSWSRNEEGLEEEGWMGIRFSGTMTQTVNPGSAPTSSGDRVVLRSGNLYQSRDDLSSGPFDVEFYYGRTTDETFFGDWDGDGVDGIAVRRGNSFYVKETAGPGNADTFFYYGRPDDEVLIGDWDGDGVDTLAVRRGNTYFFTNGTNGGQADDVITYGRVDDVILVGDWDGDGVDTLAVRRADTYFFKNEIAGGAADDVIVFGSPDDVILIGDWDGDGVDTQMIRYDKQFLALDSFHHEGATHEFDLGNGTETAYIARLK